eukprot:jgi/Tetstr1/435864/TSEL_024752.t1
MGWSLSLYYSRSLNAAFNRRLRRPDYAGTSQGVRRAKLGMGRAQAYVAHDSHPCSESLSRHPDKGQWEPVQRLEHLGMEFDSRSELASLVSHNHFLFLAIKPARFYLRELHDVLRTKDSWSGRVKWWVTVPNHSNGRSIYKPVETAYMHVDSSGYGWGAVLNETTEACELRKLRFILDPPNDISIRARYIKTTANIWVDRLSREIDYDDWAFNLRHFNHLDNMWGRHTIDRFATMENEQEAKELVRVGKANSKKLIEQLRRKEARKAADARKRKQHQEQHHPQPAAEEEEVIDIDQERRWRSS